MYQMMSYLPWNAGLSVGAIMKKMLPQGEIVKTAESQASRANAIRTISYLGPYTLVAKGVGLHGSFWCGLCSRVEELMIL